MVKRAKFTELTNHNYIFQESSIRRVWHSKEWLFSVVDVCATQRRFAVTVPRF